MVLALFLPAAVLLLLILFSFLFLPGNNSSAADAYDESALKWKLDMVHKVRFDHSKNFMGVHRHGLKEEMEQQNRRLPIWDPDIIYFGNADLVEMKMYFGMDRPNMDIQFSQDAHGIPYCNISVYGEENYAVDKAYLESGGRSACKFFKSPDHFKLDVYKPYCTVPADDGGNKPKYIRADGIFNKPLKAPTCLYDFYQAARGWHEYELFRYCAKGYFYQGKAHDDPKAREFRNDWLLYLTEGQLVCNISGNVETDSGLMAKGYSLKLLQRSHLLGDCEYRCYTRKGVVSSYEDRRSDGKFMLAGILGSLQLEGKVPLWDRDNLMVAKNVIRTKEGSGGDWAEQAIRVCYYIYENCLRIEDTRYQMYLKIEHHCTPRAMRAQLLFDVSVGPEQVPTGVFEDAGVRVYLNMGTLQRTTGQVLPNLAVNGTIGIFNKDNGTLTATEKRIDDDDDDDDDE